VERRDLLSLARSRALQSHADDACGEEVDAVTVKVAAGAVVMLGGAGVSVSGENLRIAPTRRGAR
jgi:hypothetical protein